MKKACLLLSNPLERGIIVETKITGVNDMIGSSLSSKLIERLEVSYTIKTKQSHVSQQKNSSPSCNTFLKDSSFNLTPHISNAQHSDGTGLDDPPLIGEQRLSANRRDGNGSSCGKRRLLLLRMRNSMRSARRCRSWAWRRDWNWDWDWDWDLRHSSRSRRRDSGSAVWQGVWRGVVEVRRSRLGLRGHVSWTR